MCVVDPLDRGVGKVELVLDLTDDLLEDVLQRDDPVHVPVLVDHDCHVLLLPPEVGEQRGEVLRLGHDEGRARDRLELHRRDAEVVHRREEVTHVEDADHVVERVPEDRVPRERRIDHGREGFLGRHVRRDGDDVRARHHDRGDLLRGEVEDLVEHLLLRLLELADVFGGGDAVADVLARVGDHPRGRGSHAQQSQNDVRRHLKRPDDRVRDPREQVERDGERHCEHLGFLQGNGLGDELAEHDGQVGQDRERDQERDGRRQRRFHEVGDQRFADGADEDRGDRDPDLHGRDEAHGVVHQPERRPRTATTAPLRPPLEAAAPRGHEGVLRGDEDRVPEHEHEDHDDPEGRAHPTLDRRGRRTCSLTRDAPIGAPVLGGWSSTIDQAAV